MKILISTGIYPPKIGGPAQYAKNLYDGFSRLGHKVSISTYTIENYLPTGIRHLFYLVKIIPKVISSDICIVLDTYSVGFPTIILAKIFGKKTIIRTGGDFLWEQYTERTRKKVLFRNFYLTEKKYFSNKEKIIFYLTKWTLKNTDTIIFSTEWQRNIFIDAYGLNNKKIQIIENYYGNKESDLDFDSKTLVSSSRKLVWKNLDILYKAFQTVKFRHPEIALFDQNLPYEKFMEKLARSYAFVLVSLGDISPNAIMDAIRLNRPFICTTEIGIIDRIKDAGFFVDPLNENEICEKIEYILTNDGYIEAKNKVKNFNFVHTWEQICDEFIIVIQSL